MSKILQESVYLRSLLSALIGALAYGAWGFAANYMHSADAALMVAGVQGTFSFVITLILTGVMEFLYKKLSYFKYAEIITIVTTCLILYISSYTINYLAETPNIILTILPGAIASSVFVWGYIYTLKKLSKK